MDSFATAGNREDGIIGDVPKDTMEMTEKREEALPHIEKYTNPVFPGDWSDPALLRHENVYYTCRSSFGWQPGIPICKSYDLETWEFCGHALDHHPEIPWGNTFCGVWGLDMAWLPRSKKFVIVFPIYGSARREIWSIVATDPHGPWSEPVPLELQRYLDTNDHAYPCDPAVFVDPQDNQAYLVWSQGLLVTLSDDGLTAGKLVGNLGLGNGLDFEGPQILWRTGWYHCFYSSGGTSPFRGGAIRHARARTLDGLWHSRGSEPLMVSEDHKNPPLGGPQHPAVVECDDGSWVMAHHSYSLDHPRLARQFCLTELFWEDDWPRVNWPPAQRVYTSSLHAPREDWCFHIHPPKNGTTWISTRDSLEIRPAISWDKPEQWLQHVPLIPLRSSHGVWAAEIEFFSSAGTLAGPVAYHDPEHLIALLMNSFGQTFIRIHNGAKRAWHPGPEIMPASQIGLMIQDNEKILPVINGDSVEKLFPPYICPDLGWQREDGMGRFTGTMVGAIALLENAVDSERTTPSDRVVFHFLSMIKEESCFT